MVVLYGASLPVGWANSCSWCRWFSFMTSDGTIPETSEATKSYQCSETICSFSALLPMSGIFALSGDCTTVDANFATLGWGPVRMPEPTGGSGSGISSCYLLKELDLSLN